jgi:hypothetical protein
MLLFHPLTLLRRLVLLASLLLLWLLYSPPLPGQARGVTRTFDSQSATGTTSGFQVTLGQGAVPAKHTSQLVVTSLPATCTYHLEGTLDNSTWLSLSGAIDCAVAANRMFHVVNRPVTRVRGDLTVVTGTAATATDCTNASPIEVTTSASHGFTTGDKVTITGVTGNTACNVTNSAVTVTAANKFTVAVAGNGAYAAGGAIVTVPTIQLFYLGVVD